MVHRLRPHELMVEASMGRVLVPAPNGTSEGLETFAEPYERLWLPQPI